MTKLKLATFTSPEIDFLKEYTEVMAPVATALDRVQQEKQAYLGVLLPILANVVMILKESQNKSLLFCRPLVDALMDGMNKRFSPLLDDTECQLAAAFHPQFGLFWLEQYDPERVWRVRNAMERAVEEGLQDSAESGGGDVSSDEKEMDNFFAKVTRPSKGASGSTRSLRSKASNLVTTWLDSPAKQDFSDATFLGEPVLAKLFVRYNTTIPSSAAVERFFSVGKDIMRPKRAALSDNTFEMLMFLKGNSHHWVDLE
jgi:hypothetical protein